MKKKAYQGNYISVIEENGWEYVLRHNCSGIVIILALTPDSRLIFVEQFRIPVNNRVIEFPAGLAGDIHESRDEPMEEAARRELLEETGYEAGDISFLIEGPPSSGLSAEIISFFYAKDLRKVAEGGGDDSESIQVHEIPFDEVEEWLLKKSAEGVLVDPKVYTGLYFLQKNHK